MVCTDKAVVGAKDGGHWANVDMLWHLAQYDGLFTIFAICIALCADLQMSLHSHEWDIVPFADLALDAAKRALALMLLH